MPVLHCGFEAGFALGFCEGDGDVVLEGWLPVDSAGGGTAAGLGLRVELAGRLPADRGGGAAETRRDTIRREKESFSATIAGIGQ